MIDCREILGYRSGRCFVSKVRFSILVNICREVRKGEIVVRVWLSFRFFYLFFLFVKNMGYIL